MTNPHPNPLPEGEGANAPRRYNSGIQRSKGFLEMAAGLYDTSLSFEVTRGMGIKQTDSRVGSGIFLSLNARLETQGEGSGVSLSFATGGMQGLAAVASHEISVFWLNPSVGLTMAYRGKGPFGKPLPLRTIAVFPSWDVMGFAVHESTGITSLEEIAARRYPLKLSVGRTVDEPFLDDSTMFSVAAVMRAAGFSLSDVREWGGDLQLSARPSHPVRRAGIEEGTVNAIFDEGILSWGRPALNHGFRFLPVDGGVLAAMQALGYRKTVMSKERFPEIPEEVQTVDFSGWPMVVHEDMADEVAYALCEAIELRLDAIPSDNFKPLSMPQLCASDDEEAPRDVPLHPGAERFYRERGYLG